MAEEKLPCDSSPPPSEVDLPGEWHPEVLPRGLPITTHQAGSGVSYGDGPTPQLFPQVGIPGKVPEDNLGGQRLGFHWEEGCSPPPWPLPQARSVGCSAEP